MLQLWNLQGDDHDMCRIVLNHDIDLFRGHWTVFWPVMVLIKIFIAKVVMVRSLELKDMDLLAAVDFFKLETCKNDSNISCF